jgi:sRNA-binding carbon storage regulator CsrA
MLVLTRRRKQIVYLDFSGMSDAELLSLRSAEPIAIEVDDIRGDRVRLAFDAPRPVGVHRQEVFTPAVKNR